MPPAHLPCSAGAPPTADAWGQLWYPCWGPGPRPQLVWGREPPTPQELAVLHCDSGLLVLNKPAGLPVHPVSRYHEGTVVGRLRARLGRGFAAPVHRLDRETSGVLLCARTRQMAAMLTKLFLQKTIKKEYLAICHGPMAAHRFSVDAPIGEGGRLVRTGVHIAAAWAGKPAHTTFSCHHSFERQGAPYSVWHAVPHTGRRHQIRAHLRQAGLPVVGDKIYGAAGEELYDKFCAHMLTDADWHLLQMPRQALHAWRLSFVHPLTRAPVCFEAPWPQDMRRFVAGAL